MVFGGCFLLYVTFAPHAPHVDPKAACGPCLGNVAALKASWAQLAAQPDHLHVQFVVNGLFWVFFLLVFFCISGWEVSEQLHLIKRRV